MRTTAGLRYLSVCVCILALGGDLLAQGRGGPPPDAAAVERGAGLYNSNCSFCHGSQGRGSEQAPSLLRNPLFGQDRKGEPIIAAMKEGRPGKGMPSFKTLPEQDASDIVAYLRSRLMEARGILPETALLVGDAKAGQAYFSGAGRCSSCHSASGDLAGVGTRLNPLALAVAFLTPAAKKPVTVKVTTPTGQTVSGNLRYIDEFVVSLDDSSGEYHSWSRDNLKSVVVSDPLAGHKEQLARYSDTDIHNLLAYLVTLK
jgi:mono/diheme cytochrome c family protein